MLHISNHWQRGGILQPQPVFPKSGSNGLRLTLEPLLASHPPHTFPCKTQPCSCWAMQLFCRGCWGQCLCSDMHERGQGGAWESSAGPHLYPATAWCQGPHSLSEGPSPRGCAQPWVGCRTLVSDHPTQPLLPALVLVPPSPAECLLPSTSCLILSFGTFRYLLQLHTWEKREGRW